MQSEGWKLMKKEERELEEQEGVSPLCYPSESS
jgi:hypothetical protein